MIRVGPGKIDVLQLLESVRRPESGALVLFVGCVRCRSEGRRVTKLLLEAYYEMASEQLARIVEEAKQRFGIVDASVVHRTGTLRVGEDILAVAVSSEHRQEAYEASMFIVDRLKEEAAIWKKEIGEGGEIWIEEGGRRR